MSASIREEIRAILREELAAILSEKSNVQVESIQIDTSEDLNAFAKQLIERALEPGFSQKVLNGEIRFALKRTFEPSRGHAIPAAIIPKVSAPPPPSVPMLDKTLISESDLSAFSPGTLRIPVHARVTPLAKDEARRKGIRIERAEK